MLQNYYPALFAGLSNPAFSRGKSTPKRNVDIIFATKAGRKETEWVI
jgi:hypothetical protein